jgi:hypothetical protein
MTAKDKTACAAYWRQLADCVACPQERADALALADRLDSEARAERERANVREDLLICGCVCFVAGFFFAAVCSYYA